MAPMLEQLETVAKSIELNPPKLKLISNVSATPIAEPDLRGRYLAVVDELANFPLEPYLCLNHIQRLFAPDQWDVVSAQLTINALRELWRTY